MMFFSFNKLLLVIFDNLLLLYLIKESTQGATAILSFLKIIIIHCTEHTNIGYIINSHIILLTQAITTQLTTIETLRIITGGVVMSNGPCPGQNIVSSIINHWNFIVTQAIPPQQTTSEHLRIIIDGVLEINRPCPIKISLQRQKSSTFS